MQALKRSLEPLALFLVVVICLCASWGTYRLFMTGITPVTLPAFLLLATLPFAAIAYGKRINLTHIDALPAILAFGVGASYLWALYPQAWLQQLFWYISCISVYYAVRIYIYSPRFIFIVIIAAAIGGIIGSLMIDEVVNEWGNVSDRLSVPGLNRNFTSYVFAATIFLLIIFSRYLARTRLQKVVPWVVCAILAYFIVRLGTRGALISVSLMVVWIVYARLFGSRIAPLAFAVSGVGCLLLSFGALETAIVAIDGLFQRDTGDLSGRLPVWGYARHLIADHFFTGIGAGAFQFVNPAEIGAHNVFLVILLDTGILGFLLFVAFIVGSLWPALRAGANPRQQFILGLFTAFFFPIAVSGHIELSPFTWLVFALTFTVLRLNLGSARA